MNAVVTAIEAATPPLPPAPPPPANELVQDIEHGIRVAETGNVEDALTVRTVSALSRLHEDTPPAYARLRRRLMKADPAITGPLIERLVREHVGAAAGDAAPESDGRPGTVEALVEQVQALGELFTAPDGIAYVRLHGSPRKVQALGSKAFRETVSHSYYRETGRAPKAAQLADAMTTLAGIAQHEGEVREVHLRVAVDPAGGYLLDLCDDAWRVIRITPGGWQVLDESPVLFRRTPGMKALPTPARDGTRDDLVSLFNIEPDDELLLEAGLLETLRPDTPEPITEFCGEHGSGKTRSASNFRALIDPHEAPLRAPPRSIDDLYVSAANNRIMAHDNVSSLSADMQDAHCLISTGGASAKRTLYSDADETTINVKRPILLTSITTPFTRPDALSRVLRFECPSLASGRRLSDAELVADLARRAPRALGYLLDTFCRALALLPSVEVTNAPRLLDFTRLGEAIAQVESKQPGDFTALYTESLSATATQSLEAEPVLATLTGLLDESGGRIPLTEIEPLRAELARYATRNGTAAPPANARGLGSLLSRYAPALLLTGVRISYAIRSARGRRVSVERVSSSANRVSRSGTTCTTYTTCTDPARSARCARSACSDGPANTSEKETLAPDALLAPADDGELL